MGRLVETDAAEIDGDNQDNHTVALLILIDFGFIGKKTDFRKHLGTTMVAPNCFVAPISMVQLSWDVSGRMQNPNNKYPAFNIC